MVEKLAIQIALEGGAEVEKQLADIGAAGQKAFSDIEKAAQGGGGFQAATKSIGALGTTASQALGAAAAAAQKFGASANELAGVESVIRALGARARDTSIAFSVLAANYDKARDSASNFVAVNKEAGTSLATLITRATIVGVAVSAVVTAITVAAKATLAFGETIQKASAEATKLGLILEQFNNQVQGLEKLGLSTKAATEGLQQLGKAAEQVKLDAVAKAIKELEEASARGFGAQGTAQLKILEDAAKGVGEGAKLARAELEKLGLPIPTDVPKTLAEFVASTGNAKAGMEAFLAQLRQMPDGLDRTNLAIANLGQKAGTEFVQALRLAEGSMSPVEAKAEQLRQATERLSSEWGRFGSLTFSPAVVQGIDLATASLQGLDRLLTSMNWSAVGTAASLALNPLPTLIQLITGAFLNMGSQGAQSLQAATAAAGSAAEQMGRTAAAAGSAAQQMALLGQTGEQAGQQAAQGLQLVTNPLTGMPELIRTTNDALAQTGTTGTTSFGQVGTAAQTTNTTVSTFASTIAGWNWNPIAAGVQVWNDITAAIQGAIDKFLTYIGLRQSAPATGGGAPGKASGGLLGGRGSGTSDSNLAWVSRGEYIMPASAVRQPGVLAFLEAMRRSGGIPGFAVGGRIEGQFETGLTEFLQGIFRITDQLGLDLANIATQISDASNKLLNLAVLAAGGGHARGGLLGGRGTGTSDSNLAWVSRGEHIMPARAVAQPGVLAFLEALRRSGGNLAAVLDGMGRFALGGMIRGPMPAFASGGLAGGMSNVTIQFPGLPAIGGLRASSDVVDQLHKAAALAQVRSGGRKPSRYS